MVRALTVRSVLPFSFLLTISSTLLAQAQAPAAKPGVAAAWTLQLKGDIHWQQVTPAGTLLISTDASLAAVDVERGQLAWDKPGLGGLPVDSVRMVEGSLLMEAAGPGLLV